MVMGGIEARKRDHIDLCMDLGDEAEFREKTTWFEYVELVHNALPELDLDDISLEAELLGRRFSYPLLIEGMTGGTEKAYDVNRSLAEAADRLNIPMGVGSERAGVENRELARTYRVARETSSKLFLIGNISGVQLAREGVGYAEKAAEIIEADALAIHLNCLQELVQPEGTPFFRGVLEAIRKASE
ncbi:MAG: type 2 isopentenyl-diphosphate Delta-isomerase, partial [Thaumarchaeota archaeon]